jgi:hypothetical protein
MPGEPLSYWEFLKAAFWRPVRSRVLGAMPLTQMLLAAFGLAGFFNPGFWLLGLAAVVAFVGGRSASQRFQTLVQGERLLARQAERAQGADNRMQRAYARLDPASQSRYGALVQQCREILGLASPVGEAGFTDLRAGNLNQLLWLFLRLLTSRELVTDTIARVDRRQLEQGIESLRGRVAAAGEPDGALARSLKATLEIQEKRLTNLETATKNLAVIDAELERIEQQVRLVREESAVSGGPEALSSRLDAVSATLSETSRWMDQNAEIFSSMATDELDAGAVPSLPSVPEVEARPAGAAARPATPATPPPIPRPRPTQRQR